VIAYKFLARGAVSPFTGFRWPRPSEWVLAPPAREDAWVHACRVGDLPYWLDDELWRIELWEPVRAARYQIASARARLEARIEPWDPTLGREYARACALRARDLALPHLAAPLRRTLERIDDAAALGAAVERSGSRAAAAGYLGDAARSATAGQPATASYVACVLAASVGDGLPAFEAERAWQARWLAERLDLEPATRGPEQAGRGR
jgi:hypothetical protein